MGVGVEREARLGVSDDTREHLRSNTDVCRHARKAMTNVMESHTVKPCFSQQFMESGVCRVWLYRQFRFYGIVEDPLADRGFFSI